MSKAGRKKKNTSPAHVVERTGNIGRVFHHDAPINASAMSKRKVTVYTAHKVRTMDPGRPEVEAVAAGK